MLMQMERGLMIDLEFLSKEPDASVVQIAMVLFDVKGEEISHKNFYINEINGSVDMSTLSFHAGKGIFLAPEQRMMKASGIGTRQAMNALVHWMNENYNREDKIWAKGSLDFPILTRLFKLYSSDSELPWNWWKEHELRTLIHVAGVQNRNGGHNALGDCRVQIELLKESLDAINRGNEDRRRLSEEELSLTPQAPKEDMKEIRERLSEEDLKKIADNAKVDYTKQGKAY